MKSEHIMILALVAILLVGLFISSYADEWQFDDTQQETSTISN